MRDMKVRITYTVDIDDDTRRAINRYYGKPGIANRDEIRQWFERFGDSMQDDMDYDDHDPSDGYGGPRWDGPEIEATAS